MIDRAWESLSNGDYATFDRRAKPCMGVWEFATCAGLVDGGNHERL